MLGAGAGRSSRSPRPAVPTDPPPNPLPPGIYPIIGPELATYGVVQPIARQIGPFTIARHAARAHRRYADRLRIRRLTSRAGAAPAGPAFFGQQIDNRYQAFADPRTSGQLFGFQAGFDMWRGKFLPGHRDATGLYFAYGNTDLDVNGLVTNAAATAYVPRRTGSTRSLRLFRRGLLDALRPWRLVSRRGGAGHAYTGNATTQFASCRPTARASSLRWKRAIRSRCRCSGRASSWSRRRQILWQHISFNQANDGLGQVALGTTSGATGRLGLRGNGLLSAKAGRCGSLMCAPISGGTGVAQRRRHSALIRCRYWSGHARAAGRRREREDERQCQPLRQCRLPVRGR